MYFKITNINENNDGFQYADGLNICPSHQELFWVTDEKSVLGYLGHGYYLRDIVLPICDPNLVIKPHFSKTKWLTNKIILGQKYVLSDIKTIQYLLDIGADVQANDNYALRWAADNGYANIVKLLIENGANVNALNSQALCWACESGHLNVVRNLIDNGVNIETLQNEPLRLASMSGHYLIVKILLENGANPNAFGDEAIILAKNNGHDSIVELLRNYKT